VKAAEPEDQRVQPRGSGAGALPESARVQLLGEDASWGWKGAVGTAREKSAAALRTGSRAMFSRAVRVLVGADADDGVAAERRLPHGVESPAAPPAELMQAEIMLASVLICEAGAVAPVGSEGPGTKPVEGSTKEAARVNAAERPAASIEEEPIAEAEVMNGARADTAATVVRSSIMMKVEAESELHEPRAVMRVRAALLVPAERPGLPPVAVI